MEFSYGKREVSRRVVSAINVAQSKGLGQNIPPVGGSARWILRLRFTICSALQSHSATPVEQDLISDRCYVLRYRHELVMRRTVAQFGRFTLRIRDPQTA